MAKLGKLYLAYLKQHKKSFALFFCFIIIFAGISFLYHIKLEPVFYAIVLTLCLGIVGLSADFIGFAKRHKLLEDLAETLEFATELLPPAQNLPEADYQNIIKLMQAQQKFLVSCGDKSKREMVDFYTLWVHQIKTPIAALSLILQGDDQKQNRQALAELFKIEQYVEMVLSYLRLDSDYSDFVIKAYSLDDIVKQAVSKYATLFISKKIRLDLQPLNINVLTDEKWLLFVIEQILANAIKYTAKGTITIYLQSDATLVIADTGIGIEAEDIPRLCSKGFTGYNGRADKKATGLGLYLCKTILTKLEHSLDFTSQVGVGTKVMLGLIPAEQK